MTEAQPFMPDWVSPPGDTIEDLLEEREWTKAEFAERIGFTPKYVNELVKGRAAISADAAGRLSLVLGSTTAFWLEREAHYRAALEHKETVAAAQKSVAWLKELPLQWLRKHARIGARRSGERVLEALQFFGVASVEAWRSCYETPLAAFRASPKVEKKLGAVAAWLRLAELRATALECEAFDKSRFKLALSGLRELTNEPAPEVFIPKLVETCAAAGVAVVFVPAPPGCPASGATRWLSATKAMLVLSLRHKSNDHLWFTFFHEAAHIILHGKKLLFVEAQRPDVEGLNGLEEKHEAEADRFASDLLIPPAAARALANRSLAKAEVRRFAAEFHVAPGIVVGRLQKEGRVLWSQMNDLKVYYEWAPSEAEDA